MERTERLFNALGDIDPALIAAVDLRPAAKSRAAWKKWLPAVACLCLAAVIGLAARLMPQTENDMAMTADRIQYPAAETVTVTASSTNELESSLHGGLGPQTSAGCFGHFQADGITYSVVYSNIRIANMFLDSELGKAQADATSPSNPETRPITYYRILGISEQCAVAVIFEGENDIYIYSNDSYRPATMAELFENMGLDEYLTLTTVTTFRAENEQLHTTVYKTDTERIISHLLSRMMDQAPVSVSGKSVSPAARPFTTEIVGNMAMFGDPHLTIRISHNGYLILPLFGNSYVFEIGEELLAEYLAALEKHADSVRTETEIIPPTYSLINDGTMASVYDRITVGDISYRCNTLEYGIDADRVGEPLGEVKLGAFEQAPTVTYYRLVGVAKECGIAVRFPDTEIVYSYHNPDYRPETLGDLIEDMGLVTYLRQGNPTVTYREATVTQSARFTKNDPDLLWQYLLANTQAENIATDERWGPDAKTVRIEIPLMLPLFTGSKEYYLWITEDGTLRMNLLDNYCLIFPLGCDETQQAQYLFQMIMRYPDFGLKVEDSVQRPHTSWTWQDAPTYERYTGFEADGSVYSTEYRTADPTSVGEQLGTGVAVGFDPKTRIIHHTPIAYYAIRDIPTAESVAVRFTAEGDQQYYLYTDQNYSADTLGIFFRQTDWHETVTILTCAAYVEGVRNTSAKVRFLDVDMTLMKNELFTETDAPNIYKSDGIKKGGARLLLDAEMRKSDGSTVPLRINVYSHGYLTVYLDRDQNNPLCFDIGTEHTDVFFAHILNDCTDNTTVSSGTMRLQAGETRQDAIVRQLREALGAAATE